MNPSQKPSRSSTQHKPDAPESTREGNSGLKSGDFPSGDEADRKGGNAGPEEKRHPGDNTIAVDDGHLVVDGDCVVVDGDNNAVKGKGNGLADESRRQNDGDS